MSHCPDNIRYTATHEWVKVDGQTATVGITDFAQRQMGDLVFVELPTLDRTVKNGDEVAVVESVKTAADVYCPIAGTIIAINEELSTVPENINQDPYGKGWLFRVTMSDPTQYDRLLTAKAYAEQISANTIEK